MMRNSVLSLFLFVLSAGPLISPQAHATAAKKAVDTREAETPTPDAIAEVEKICVFPGLKKDTDASKRALLAARQWVDAAIAFRDLSSRYTHRNGMQSPPAEEQAAIVNRYPLSVCLQLAITKKRWVHQYHFGGIGMITNDGLNKALPSVAVNLRFSKQDLSLDSKNITTKSKDWIALVYPDSNFFYDRTTGQLWRQVMIENKKGPAKKDYELVDPRGRRYWDRELSEVADRLMLLPAR